jgi:hypothetical protein
MRRRYEDERGVGNSYGLGTQCRKKSAPMARREGESVPHPLCITHDAMSMHQKSGTTDLK